MINLRYKDIKWTIPSVFNDVLFFEPINSIITNFIQDNNPIETLCDFRFYVNIYKDFLNENVLDNSKKNYSLQCLYPNFSIEKNLLYKKEFDLFLFFLNKFNFSLIISNDFLFNFVKSKYKNIKLIACEQKIQTDRIIDRKIEYYEMLCNKYDRVILNPKYVKEEFFKHYKSFSDVSKFEIYVNYDISEDLIKNIKNSFALTNDEIKMLVEEVGIKHFRLYGFNKNFSCFIEDMFRYIFNPEPEVIYIFSKLINDYYFNYEYNNLERIL